MRPKQFRLQVAAFFAFWIPVLYTVLHAWHHGLASLAGGYIIGEALPVMLVGLVAGILFSYPSRILVASRARPYRSKSVRAQR